MIARTCVGVVFGLLATSGLFAQEKPTSNYFTTKDGIKIHYLVQGTGTPVILIHGYTSSAEGNWGRNGIMEALAKNHKVVALDCRNHGKSDKPQPGARGRPEDVIELLEHLKIEKAHFHGYSMGGSIMSHLMARIPEKFITASFGGSGVPETDPEWQKKVPPDKPDPQGGRRTQRRSAERSPGGAGSGPLPPPKLDLTKINFPVIAIVGEYDEPNRRTHRLQRELKNFKLTVLPGKTHLTAIAATSMPKEYLETLLKFINENDPKQ